jgi:hypothetical protein
MSARTKIERRLPFDPARRPEYGLAYPPLILILYGSGHARPLLTVETGDLAADTISRYAYLPERARPRLEAEMRARLIIALLPLLLPLAARAHAPHLSVAWLFLSGDTARAEVTVGLQDLEAALGAAPTDAAIADLWQRTCSSSPRAPAASAAHRRARPITSTSCSPGPAAPRRRPIAPRSSTRSIRRRATS